jgi:predicted dehydrogenase
MADDIAAWQGQRPEVYENVETLLSTQQSLDATDICAVHRAHHTLAIPCLEAGKHVTIEKPLAITMRAGKLILDAAARSGKLLQVAEQYRRSPEQRAIHWAIKGGRIGTPRMLFWIEARERLWYWNWREHREQAGGGWTLDGGVHFADLFRYHLGEITTVSALMRTFYPTRYRDRDSRDNPVTVDVEDTTLANLEFEGGQVGQWTETNVAPGRGFGDRMIYGSEGSLDFSSGLQTPAETLTLAELRDQYLAQLDEGTRDRLFPHGVTESVGSELGEFVRAVRGDGSIETDGMEGYLSEAVSIAVYEAAVLGRPVSVTEVAELQVEAYQQDLNEGLSLV